MHHLLAWHLSRPHIIAAAATAVALFAAGLIVWRWLNRPVPAGRPARYPGESRREAARIHREIAAERDRRREAAWDRAYGRRS